MSKKSSSPLYPIPVLPRFHRRRDITFRLVFLYTFIFSLLNPVDSRMPRGGVKSEYNESNLAVIFASI